MLVLSRLKNETVIIGEDIEVTVIDVRGDKVRLGINAPRNVRVDRKEVHDAIRAQNKDAARMQPGDLTRAPKTPPPSPVRADPSLPETSALFTVHRDPQSGVESFVLTQRVAGLQQTFDPASPCASADGRYLWFFCANPPAGTLTHGRTLGVIDFGAGEVHDFPETQFGHSSPTVERKTGSVFWSTGDAVYRRSPAAGEKARLVSRFPATLLKGQPLAVSSRLSLSSDGQHVSFDIAPDGGTIIGSIAVSGGEPEVWLKSTKRFASPLFSPVDPDLMLVALESNPDERQYHLLRRGQKPEPLLGKDAAPRTAAVFTADGRHVLLAGPSGVSRVESEGRREEVLSTTPCVNVAGTHDTYGFAFDGGAAGADAVSRLTFCNRKTRRDAAVVSRMSAAAETPYAVAPSPQFTADGKYLVYTTTALGHVDVAFTPVRTLLNATT